MKLNAKKTKLMLFNPANSIDFMPSFLLNNEEIELVEETRLLGLVIRSDMSWTANTASMVKRSNSKLWILRRLSKLGATRDDLLDIYFKQIRSILEFAVPVWHSSISKEERLEIERIQKSACHIMLGKQYQSYSKALKVLGLDTLFDRRKKLCKKFARKSVKNEKFNKWFKVNNKVSITRQRLDKFCNVYSRTVRFDKSPISYLTRILNSMKC